MLGIFPVPVQSILIVKTFVIAAGIFVFGASSARFKEGTQNEYQRLHFGCSLVSRNEQRGYLDLATDKKMLVTTTANPGLRASEPPYLRS